MVAPPAGAWIETLSYPSKVIPSWRSPLPQGRGLKLDYSAKDPTYAAGRPSRRGVD